jgi:hypothetical protein
MTGYQSKRAAAQDRVNYGASSNYPPQPAQEPVVERAWFTIAELNAWADKKLAENPHWVMPAEEPERKEALAQPAQEPVAWMWRCKPYYDYPNWEVSLTRPADSGRDGNKKTDGYEDVPLYTTPPQPAQEPVAWHSIETMYPQGEMLDIRMGNGSILCDVWPQSDGDLWWEGSGTGEKFIDPKYANVTHWRVHSDTTPPQRPWVEPTGNEWFEWWRVSPIADSTEAEIDFADFLIIAQTVMTKLKEKNNG